jgi:Kef-type K+ transport system membrane component KefB
MEISRETLLVVLAVAALAPVLADLPTRVRIPIVVTEIVAGIVVGPQVLDLARPDPLLEALAELGLAFLFFMAGMEIDPVRMRGRPAALAARGWAGSLVLGTAAALALWAVGGVGAPVLVGLALTTTALGALVPILKDAGLAEHRVGRLTLAAGAAGEFGPIVALSVVLAIESGEPWRTVLLLVFAVVAGGRRGSCAWWTRRCTRAASSRCGWRSCCSGCSSCWRGRSASTWCSARSRPGSSSASWSAARRTASRS